MANEWRYFLIGFSPTHDADYTRTITSHLADGCKLAMAGPYGADQATRMVASLTATPPAPTIANLLPSFVAPVATAAAPVASVNGPRIPRPTDPFPGARVVAYGDNPADPDGYKAYDAAIGGRMATWLYNLHADMPLRWKLKVLIPGKGPTWVGIDQRASLLPPTTAPEVTPSAASPVAFPFTTPSGVTVTPRKGKRR